MTERYSCARASRARGEPVFATASKVRRWICVEQPGPWGVDAVRESRLPQATATGLLEVSRAVGARVLLLRRHGRPDPAQREFTVYVAATAPGRRWVERFTVERPGEILDVDLAPLRRAESVGGTPVPHPLYLVCTNGRHDVCCAEFGRPLAAALSRTRPDRTWECSHIGGDRFAGNLLILPHGLYYGRLTAELGPEVAAAYEDGELVLEHWRGRAGYAFAIQAAEHLLRAAEGWTGVDDVRLVGRERAGAVDRVRFTGPDGSERTVEVETGPADEGMQLTCSASGLSCPPRYTLRDIR